MERPLGNVHGLYSSQWLPLTSLSLFFCVAELCVGGEEGLDNYLICKYCVNF